MMKFIKWLIEFFLVGIIVYLIFLFIEKECNINIHNAVNAVVTVTIMQIFGMNDISRKEH